MMLSLSIYLNYLIRELDVIEPGMKFEFAVYDCYTNDLVYGNCCEVNDLTKDKIKEKLPKLDNFTYYFVVRLPEKNKFLIYNLRFFFLLGLFTLILVFAYFYAIRILYRQKKLSELQKDFVDNMTHEFKTPLTSISLASSVLLDNKKINEDSKLTKYSQIIKQQSDKLTSHVERLLDLIRSDEKFKLNLEEFDLIELIDKLNLEFNNNGKQAFKINFHHPKEKIIVNADKYHFYNVLLNIYDNALKYNDKKSVNIDINLTENSNNILLTIRDNGIGIKKDKLSNIFEKFYRVQQGDVHDVKGFGLGLYYVKNIIEHHGWTIEVDSEEHNWTEFKITIKK
ncbi:MAG: HAMP domain-containing sensor histidine kinase [Saprospiraceae bacterium]